ncbi:MAG: type II toxin-antitoxin system RelE/ParE family toxin [Aliivibrio sp.]|nr:type II toxin-antitoxin system RelE/ParE family toxin [Aliivibrio sp.]
MTFKLEWSAFSRDDLVSIVEYIAEDNLDAAQRVFNDIRNKTEHLRDYPQMGRIGRVAGTRELVVLGNYIVVYQERQDVIHILRVIHSSQQFPK